MGVVYKVESGSTYEAAAEYLISNEEPADKEDKAFKNFFENTDNRDKTIIKRFISALAQDIQQTHKLKFDKEAEEIDLPEGTEVKLKKAGEYRELACIAGFLTTQKNEAELKASGTGFKFLILNNNAPVKNTECKVSLKIQGDLQEEDGDFKTDDEGFLEMKIPAGVKEGKIELAVDTGHEDEDPVETVIDLTFNGLERMDIKAIESDDEKNITAFTRRLAGLGYLQKESAKLDDKTAWAVRRFQDDYELEITGELTKETVKKIDEVYGW